MWQEDLQPIKYETDILEIDEFFKALAQRRDQRCWIKHAIKMKYRFIVKEAKLVVYLLLL